MDPVTAIVSAIVAGATAALKPTTEQAIKDAYQGLKSIIVNKWKNLNLSGIESTPDSKGQKLVLEEEIAKSDAGNDQQLIAAAQQLLSTIQQKDPDILLKIGLKLNDITVKGNANIADVQGEDRGVDINSSTFEKDLNITGIKQRSQAALEEDSLNPQ